VIAFDFRHFSTSDCEKNIALSTFCMKHVVGILNFETVVGISIFCRKREQIIALYFNCD